MRHYKSKGKADASKSTAGHDVSENPAQCAEKETTMTEFNEQTGAFENKPDTMTLTLFQKGGRGKQSPYPETTVTYADFDLSSLSKEDQAKVKLSYVRGLAMAEFFDKNELFDKTKLAVEAFERNMSAAGIEIDPSKLPAILNNLLGEGNWQLERVTDFALDIQAKLAKSEE
jgi:hypothetical protein